MKKKLLLFSFLTLGAVFACEDDLEKTNPSVFTTDSFFGNTNELEQGVNSVYAMLAGLHLYAREYYFLNDLRSDECATGGAQLEPPRSAVLRGVHDATNYVIGEVWTGWYRLIHRANIVIDAQANYKTINAADEARKKRVVAEAKFFRGMAYYELGTMWGGVPVYTTSAKSVSSVNGRSTQDEVLAQSIKDLKEAQVDLEDSYTGANNGRATRFAATHELARVLMAANRYAEAKTELAKIINSGKFKLADKFSDNFLEETEYNSESIFEVSFDSVLGINWDGGDNDNLSWAGPKKSTVRHQEYSPVGWRNVIPSNKIIDEFERPSKGDAKRDPRMDYSFYFKGDVVNNGKGKLEIDYPVQGNTSILDGVEQKISWRKYSACYRNADGFYELSGINMRSMRYAETLINMAECENETGNSAAAVTLLNQVRSRGDVKMDAYPTKNWPTGNKDQVFAAIQHEKLVEHCAEQLRAKDILRWRKQGKLKTEPFSYFQANKFELLPIPQFEMDTNPKLESKNNPGY
jgi:starch-binding outer membrane protein, SusD/RagB family